MSIPRLPVAHPPRKRARVQTYTPQQKAIRSARAKAAYEARKAAGVCVYTPGCGNKTNGTAYCEECRAVERMRKAVVAEARAAAGFAASVGAS